MDFLYTEFIRVFLGTGETRVSKKGWSHCPWDFLWWIGYVGQWNWCAWGTVCYGLPVWWQSCHLYTYAKSWVDWGQCWRPWIWALPWTGWLCVFVHQRWRRPQHHIIIQVWCECKWLTRPIHAWKSLPQCGQTCLMLSGRAHSALAFHAALFIIAWLVCWLS